MATTTQIAPSASGVRFKTALWISLGLTAFFVFITSEVLLVADYPMYHAYRLQVIADRQLLIPHVLAGAIALLAGPVQFSSRFRLRYLKIASRPRPRLCWLCVYRRVYRDRARQRPARLAGNIHAGRRLDRLHDRSFRDRAQPANHRASPVDGAFLCGDVYLRFKPRAEPVAALLEPPGRHVFRRRRDRLHAGFAACRRHWTELARADDASCVTTGAVARAAAHHSLLYGVKPLRSRVGFLIAPRSK